MLVLTGVVGLGTLAFGGVTAAGVVVVVGLTIVVIRGRLQPTALGLRLLIALAGVAVGTAGWVGVDDQRLRVSLLTTSVALLAVAALLAAAAARPRSAEPA